MGVASCGVVTVNFEHILHLVLLFLLLTLSKKIPARREVRENRYCGSMLYVVRPELFWNVIVHEITEIFY